MAQYGLGNFVYDLTISGGNASFKFVDPDDAANTAETTVNQDDFEGLGADSRQVADKAYSQVAKQLNDARDKRIEKQAADLQAEQKDLDKRNRDAANDFFDNSSDVAVAPAKVEKDGTTVYNTENVSAPESDNNSSDKDSKSSKK
jgi:hypothetical protein